MTEKEKKAIKDLKEISHYCSLRAIDIDNKYSDLWARYIVSIQIVKNLIENFIAENKELKEKNKWKPIKEYNRQKYDWVLVKYFDGDYECVPEVAEQRIDGKWYTSEKQIPFEVKYFFDIQSLLGKE